MWEMAYHFTLKVHSVIFQQLQGLSNTVMYVGDGINDLAALAAADAGLAVGATDAMVAAALSTSRSSVAGQGPCLCIASLLVCYMV